MTRRPDLSWARVATLSAIFGLALLSTGCADSSDNLTRWIEAAQGHPLGPLVVLAAFLVSGFVAAPLTLVMLPTIVIYGPLGGGALTMVGATLAGALFFQLGVSGAGLANRFGVADLEGGKLGPLLKRNGIVAVAIARNVPVAPYPVVNFAFGASPVRFRDFLIGNTIGLLPWVVLYSLTGDQLRELAADPSPARLAVLALCIAALIALAALVGKFFRQYAPDTPEPAQTVDPAEEG
jgi:uncharacterized membrane protein YdjX (TVP38/TMEM64 family)